MRYATMHGIPIVSADEINEYLSSQGIRAWPQVRDPVSLEEYRDCDLTKEEREEINRFAPRTEVTFLQDPRGNPFRGFRVTGENWATTFALLPSDLVPIVVEFQHGAEVITLTLPSDIPNKKDMKSLDSMKSCAKREFEEETGIKLASVLSLHKEGIPVYNRKTTYRYLPFLGQVKMPIRRKASKLDASEFLKLILVPLREWLKLIESGQVFEDCAISVTFLALRKLGRLPLE